MMAKIILKHVGKKTAINYQKSASKISKIALSACKGYSSQIKIYSRKELLSKPAK